MKTAFITGITGQDGLYLTEFLHQKGYQVFGLAQGQNNPRAAALTQSYPFVEILSGNLLDLSSLLRAVTIAQPDEVYNLAAISNVAYSWHNARLTADVNGGGVLNLLEAVRFYQDNSGKRVRFYQASTSEMFGKAQEVRQRETTLLWPRSPYAIAKVFGHHMTINYRESYGMHATSGILFNHESPRRPPEFLTRKISQAVARISLGLQDHVTLGNLEAKRDFGFAGDYVKAMWLMMQQETADDYVISTGEAHSVQELLDLAFGEVDIDDWGNYVRVDERYMRPAEVDCLIGDSTKAREKLGWEPTVGFEDLIRIMVRHDVEDQSRQSALRIP